MENIDNIYKEKSHKTFNHHKITLSLDAKLVAKYILEKQGYVVDIINNKVYFDGQEIPAKVNVILSEEMGHQEITLLNTESNQ